MSDACDECERSFERKMEREGLEGIRLDDGNHDGTSMCADTVFHDPTGNQAVRRVMLLKMKRRFGRLSERQRRVLLHRYGLGSFEEKSVPETAAYFHLAEGSAVKIEEGALADLRKMMNDGEII